MKVSFNKAISRSQLHDVLGIGQKLPNAHIVYRSVPCPNRLGETVAILDVEIIPMRPQTTRRKSSQHRLFVHCCGRRIPAGRYHQHLNSKAHRT